MLSIILTIMKISITTSTILLSYLLLREGLYYLRYKISNLKYKNNPILKNGYIWSIYNHSKLKYTLNDYEYDSCRSLNNKLKRLKNTLNSNLISRDEKNKVTKTIQKDLLNIKSIEDVNTLEFKVNNILNNYKHINKIEKQIKSKSDSGKILEFTK